MSWTYPYFLSEWHVASLESFNKHLSRSFAEHGSDVKMQKLMIRIMVTFGNRPGTLTRIMDRRHVTIFKQKFHRLMGYKIGLCSLFLHEKTSWKLCSFLPEICMGKACMHHIQTNITQKMNFRSLKRCVCVWAGNHFLKKFPCNRNGRPPQIPTVHRGYALSNMCDSEICRMIFTLGDHKRNLDMFSVLAIAKSLCDSAVTVFLCSWRLFEYNWSKFIVCWSQFEQHHVIVFSWISACFKLLCM